MLQAVRSSPHLFFGVRVGDAALAGRVLWRAVRDAVTETAIGSMLHVNVAIESDLVFIVSDDGAGIRTDPIAPGRAPWLVEALTIPLLGAGVLHSPRDAAIGTGDRLVQRIGRRCVA